MRDEKLLMAEAAMLYYEKNCTQQEIADILKLSRQTVSKLLGDAIKENVVEITVHNPRRDCEQLEKQLCEQFGLDTAVVCNVSSRNETLCRLNTVKAAAEYLTPLAQQNNQRIAVSWGRTVEALVEELPTLQTEGNIVFPLFGATDHGQPCFSSNELTRGIADKFGAAVRYAWFPYLPDNAADCELFRKTSYYANLRDLWEHIDLAIVGIGNTEVLELFGKTFGYHAQHTEVVGDLATHFFDRNGSFLSLYADTLCASAENLKNAKQTVAIACGGDKIDAICGALRTGLIDTLITDEYTAKDLVAAR